MNLELEKFIGKPIHEVLKLGEIDIKGENFYALKLKNNGEFFGLPYSKLTVSTNINKIVELLYVVFPETLNKSFYNEMIKCYGSPNNILANDKLISESKTENYKGEDGAFNQNVIKRSYSMKEVNFEDKPILIIWKKSYYQIEMRFYYKENGTQLTFRKLT